MMRGTMNVKFDYLSSTKIWFVLGWDNCFSCRRSQVRSPNKTTSGYAVVQLVQAHCATKPEGRGSDSPDGVTIIFHWRNPSDRNMALGSTQPLTEMSTRNSWFQTFAMFAMLYVFFCVIPRRLNFIWRRFGKHCSIFIGKYVYIIHLPDYENGTVFRNVGI
jgi:hypothetical protein